MRIRARGGSGGAGSLSFHSLGSYKRRACGGHGGRGGDVYIVADPALASLRMERHHYAGEDGGRGGRNGMQGRRGRDAFVRVPSGVVVRRVLDWEEAAETYGEVGEGREEEEEEEENGKLQARGFECDNYHPKGEDVDSDQLSANATDGEETDELVSETGSQHASDTGESQDTDSNDDENDNRDDADEEFDAYYEKLRLSKRYLRKRKHRRSALPPDYDDVVNQGVRAVDGMFHWSAPDNEEDEGLAATAYPDHRHRPARKTVFLVDLDAPGASLLVAAGGSAGVGNVAFSNRPHTTNLHAHAARKAAPGAGATVHLELELKLLADAGLVGFPNAGKSSLLNAMSRASPKIASYPFTTLEPLVGSILYRDGHRVVVADVPGLIDGAAAGRGRGTEFLRHIERTKALVYVVDGGGADGRDPAADLRVLGKELREYGSSGIFGEDEAMGAEGGAHEEEVRRRRREIMDRPSLILANKMDLMPPGDEGMGKREELLFQLRRVASEVGIVCKEGDVMGISAGVSGEGLGVFSKRLRQVVGGAP